MTLSYEEVARILAVVDMAEGQDLEFSVGGRRIALGAWGEEPVPQKPRPQKPATPEPGTGAQPPQSGFVEIVSTELGYFRPVRGLDIGSRIHDDDELGQLAGPDGEAAVVRATSGGEIVDICVADGDFVEYGQVLVTVDVNAPQDELESDGGPATERAAGSQA